MAMPHAKPKPAKFVLIPSRDRQGNPLRDAVTGEALVRGTLRLAVSDERLENARYVRQYDDPPETTPRPLRLHTPEVEEGGLGGHRFARQFAVYLARVKPTVVVTAENMVRYWWASAYGHARVRAAFLRKLGPERGQVAYEVAAWFVSAGRTCEELMAQYRLSAYHIDTFVSRARKYASQPTVRVVRPLAWRRASS